MERCQNELRRTEPVINCTLTTWYLFISFIAFLRSIELGGAWRIQVGRDPTWELGEPRDNIFMQFPRSW